MKYFFASLYVKITGLLISEKIYLLQESMIRSHVQWVKGKPLFRLRFIISDLIQKQLFIKMKRSSRMYRTLGTDDTFYGH
jgi:hypothetical protein